jgi:uncharacterized protein (DUF58 family)
MIIPTQRCVLLFMLGFPISLVPAVISGRLWPFWVASFGLTCLLIGLDALLGLPRRRLEMESSIPPMLYIGDSAAMEITLTTRQWARGASIEVQSELSEELEPARDIAVDLASDGTATFEVPLVPRRRGNARVGALWLRWTGPLGLVQRGVRRDIDERVGITPNISAVRAMALSAFQNRDFLTGLKMQHFVGDGSEFESLREFQPGLDHRAIDWKASARHLKLLCREFRAERNHQVYLAFDSGHLMAEPMEGVPLLDHAINAGLLLGYVCLKTGDRVGMFGFDDRVRLFSKPQGGVQHIHSLQRLGSQLDYGTAETNFTLGLTDLMTKLRRRSLVVVFTDFVDTVTAELMVDNLKRLANRHLVIFVTFRDLTVDKLIEQEPNSLQNLGESVIAHDFRQEREVVLRRLRRSGVHCIEAPSTNVPVQLINRYLEIKRRELV